MIRLDKYLCDIGIGTRSEVKDIVKKRRVTVDDVCITDSSFKFDETTSLVRLDGKELTYSEFFYYMMNKPAGVVSATEDDTDKTVLDLLGDEVNKKKLFPVGRLDKDTVGLLLITNDGELGHNLLHPSKHVDKCYYVELEKKITSDDIRKLEAGVDIGDDEPTKRASVEPISSTSVYLTISEGRYHQVKRMMEAVCNKVTFLKRVSFGALTLDEELQPGEYRELEEYEVSLLKKG